MPVSTDPDGLSVILRAEIEDAVDFIETDIGQERAESTKYYRGEKLGNEEDGRSQVVSRDVRDAVQSILPSLIRVFFGSDRAVEYVPANEEDVPMAEQATDYVNHVIQQDNPGFSVFYSAFKDALYNKVGVIKYWHDESVEVTYHHFTGLNDVALGALVNEPGVEVIGLESGINEAGQVHDVRIRRVRRTPRIRIQAVPPEEFLIDRRARSLDEARYVGHRTYMAKADLVALGYPESLVDEHLGDQDAFTDSEEVYERHRYTIDPNTKNPWERRALYVESYMRVDVDGDGIAELRRFCTLGEGYEIVNGDGLGEPVSDIGFAAFCPDPEPHLFIGQDIADQTKDLQRINTAVWRNTLDSLAMSIFPRTAFVEGMVNQDDVMNTEIGAAIRMRQPGMVTPFALPFVGAPALDLLDRLKAMKDERVGVHNLALEADALQSTTKAAVNAQVDAARQRLELIARVFAETGMKRLFRGLLKLVTTHQDQPRMVRLRNTWVQVDPRVWNANMDVTVNVGLGHGLVEDRMMVLRETLAAQKEALQLLGPSNPLVGLGQVRNTLARLLELSGYKDTAQFWNPLPVNWSPPPQPPKPDAAELLAQAEMAKIQADMQVDAAKLELERDKLFADVLMRAEEINAKYQQAVDVKRIDAAIQENRLTRQGQADAA